MIFNVEVINSFLVCFRVLPFKSKLLSNDDYKILQSQQGNITIDASRHWLLCMNHPLPPVPFQKCSVKSLEYVVNGDSEYQDYHQWLKNPFLLWCLSLWNAIPQRQAIAHQKHFEYHLPIPTHTSGVVNTTPLV